MAASAGATATLAPLLLRNLFTSIFIYADQSLLNLARKCKFLEFLRSFLISTFLFFLHLLPSLFPQNRTSKAPKTDQSYVAATAAGGGGDSGIARALSQVLSIVSDIPVSSRKYEVVRSLAERLIDENLQEGLEALREVNRTVLSTSFARTLNQLEAAMAEQRGGAADGCGRVDYGLNRVFRAVRSAGDVAWSRVGWRREEVSRKGSSAEKLAAELLWLAQKMEASGSGEEAVCLWASASNLAWLALSAEARLQGSLVKVSGTQFYNSMVEEDILKIGFYPLCRGCIFHHCKLTPIWIVPISWPQSKGPHVSKLLGQICYDFLNHNRTKIFKVI